MGEIVPHQEVLDQLLGDGRAPLRATGVGKIGNEGPDQPALVDAVVLEEALVLGRYECLLHMLRNVRERHPDPPLVFLKYLSKPFPSAVEHNARARELEAFELGVIGQVL
jgi:hypothetical protein